MRNRGCAVEKTIPAPKGGWGARGTARVVWETKGTVPLYQFLREVMTKKRMAWFDPCLRTVAVKPW